MPLLSALFAAAGCAAGLLLTALLFASSSPGRSAHRWLGGLLLAVVLLSLQDLFDDLRLPLEYPALGHLFDWLVFLIGPLTWWYVRRMTGEARPTVSRFAAHAVPALLTIGVLVPFWFAPGATKRTMLAEDYAASGRSVDWVLVIAVLHVLAYWAASLTVVRRFRKSLADEYSGLERIGLRWLSAVLAVNLAVWAAWAASVFVPHPALHGAAAAVVPFGLYILGFLGIRHRDAAARTQAPDARAIATAPAPGPAPASAPTSTPARYERSRLDPARLADMRARLDDLMRLEKPWLENDLTLGALAARAQLSTHHLSQLLNEQLGKTFFDYINELRAIEVRRCLDDPAYARRSVLEIGLAAGFNSQGALNASFRRFFGVTPGRYRKGSRANGAASS